MAKWHGRVGGIDLFDDDEVLLRMFPGILFGFAPSNFRALKERLDCPHCRKIAEKLKVVVIEKTDPDGFLHKLPLVGKLLDRRLNNEREALLSAVKVIEAEDREHWLDGADREVSKEFMTAYVSQYLPATS